MADIRFTPEQLATLADAATTALIQISNEIAELRARPAISDLHRERIAQQIRERRERAQGMRDLLKLYYAATRQEGS